MNLISKCYCCIIASLSILIVGFINPESLQSRDSEGKTTGHPSYAWLSIISLVVGIISCLAYN